MLLSLLREGLPADPVPQEGEATYAAKLEPDEHRLDWTRTAAYLSRVVRLGQAWTGFRGKRLKVLRAVPVPGEGGLKQGEIHARTLSVGTADGALRLYVVQPEGKSAQVAEDWARGARLKPGERFK
jgi:methionyl-tRNA formyltransferase